MQFELILIIFCIYNVKSEAKNATIDVCPPEKKFCLNGGKCRVINKQDIVCACLPGYSGLFCEIAPGTTSTTSATQTVKPVALENCPSNANICLNSGKCLIFNWDRVWKMVLLVY